MNRKIKLTLAALLGFSAACSTVKNAPAEGSDEPVQAADSLSATAPSDTLRVVAMYGVRFPRPVVGQELSAPTENKEEKQAEKAERTEAAEQSRQTADEELDDYEPADTQSDEPDYD